MCGALNRRGTGARISKWYRGHTRIHHTRCGLNTNYHTVYRYDFPYIHGMSSIRTTE